MTRRKITAFKREHNVELRAARRLLAFFESHPNCTEDGRKLLIRRYEQRLNANEQKENDSMNKPQMEPVKPVSDLKPLVQKLRDFIARRPLSEAEAINLVLEADAALKLNQTAPSRKGDDEHRVQGRTGGR